MMVTAEHLVALERKYRLLAQLRRAREEAQARGLDAFPEEERAARRGAMRALAAEFPGALRELDELPAELLAVRAEAIARGERAAWMTAAVLFHAAVREALAVRRGEASACAFWGEEPAVRGRPESGRLLDLAWRAVGERMGITPREAELLVYPSAPARGARG